MRELRTSKCSAHSHPEISISWDSAHALEDDAVQFIRGLEHLVAHGSRFEAGQTLQYGWLLGRFHEIGPGLLAVDEPDLKSFPIAWIHSVTSLLQFNRIHLDVAASIGLREKAEIPSVLDACLICTNLAHVTDYFMTREAPRGALTGWFIGCLEPTCDHDNAANLYCLSTYELATRVSRRPLPYLGLPPGIQAIVRDGQPSFTFRGTPAPIHGGSLLAASRAAV